MRAATWRSGQWGRRRRPGPPAGACRLSVAQPEAADSNGPESGGFVIAESGRSDFVKAMITPDIAACEGAGASCSHRVIRVCLSGGVFQNRILLEKTVPALTAAGFEIHLNEKVPPNDSGIALGQALVACYNLKNPKEGTLHVCGCIGAAD